MGTILGNPEDIYCVGHLTAGSVSLDKKSTCDFIDLNDISASEEAAQQKIYDLYMSSQNSSHPLKEECSWLK